ncbi:MAG: YggS family pyridoxal phosphate-dependent enzyme [Actinomycetota bacterium]|nr:YggS family pyridoxal phosphate-dependent enzyme [Actinomycetota bacterium]
MATTGLIDVRERIAAAAKRSGRDPDGVTLLAVSKGRSNTDVRESYDAGQRVFGENRPQGLRQRLDGDLPADIIWHFVGNVQRRAIKVIAPSIALLHSLDRMSLATAWTRIDKPPPVLIEINIGEEPQKHGFAPSEVLAVAEYLAQGDVVVSGLMIIPPRVHVAEDARRWFVALRELRDMLVVDHPGARDLSMGMTEDFEVAVEEGASIVRVGRAIFGPTDKQSNEHSLED